MMACPSLETAAAWVLCDDDAEQAGDPSVMQSFEEHYFGCNVCAARVDRLQRLVEQLRASVPMILTPERRRALEVLRPGMPAVNVEPGESATIRLGPKAEVALWIMHAPLARATRVDIEAHDENGEALLRMSDVPFDAARGEVVMPCQVHYQAMGAGSRMYVRLSIAEANGPGPVAEYTLDHVFESL